MAARGIKRRSPRSDRLYHWAWVGPAHTLIKSFAEGSIPSKSTKMR